MSSQLKRPRSTSVSPPPRSPPRQRKRPIAKPSPNRSRDDDSSNRTNSKKRERDPSPPLLDDETPRPRKKPTAAAAISRTAQQEASQRAQARENILHQQSVPRADVSDLVTQHYNNVPERGKVWRRTDSKIKGLRSYNNWVKSCLLHRCVKSGGNVLDIGCGKGGDLQKWASQRPFVTNYVGLDPAAVSIGQGRDRYKQMQRRGRVFRAEFGVKDCFGESLKDVEAVRRIGFDESGGQDPRWGGGNFDVVAMMFCMHYAFENEEKARTMLKNVAGALKKNGRFVGVIPNSDIIGEKVEEYHRKSVKSVETPTNADDDDDDDWDPEKTLDVKEPTPEPQGERESLNWGNSIYRVKFPGETPKDGIFRPPFGWKYFYFLEEAVEEVPEFVVPWEAFRALAEDFNLELEYRATFRDMWDSFKDDSVMGPLCERMGVKDSNGGRLVTDEEMDAASLYHCFSFYKV